MPGGPLSEEASEGRLHRDGCSTGRVGTAGTPEGRRICLTCGPTADRSPFSDSLSLRFPRYGPTADRYVWCRSRRSWVTHPSSLVASVSGGSACWTDDGYAEKPQVLLS